MSRFLSLAVALALAQLAVADANGDEAEAVATPAVPLIDQSELLDYLAGRGDLSLLDARSAEEFEAGHIYGAANVPHDRVDEFVDRLPENLDTPLLVYCKTGRRATILKSELEAHGYRNVRVLSPEQMFWAGEMPVFDCGVPAASAPSLIATEGD